MTTGELDPLIHVPTRLKIVATLAALPDGDTLSFTRLQDMIGLTPGNLIIHLRKLEEADYISSEKTRNGTVSITTAIWRPGTLPAAGMKSPVLSRIPSPSSSPRRIT